MDRIRQNQFEALSFLKVTSANTLLPHSVRKYFKRLRKQSFFLFNSNIKKNTDKLRPRVLFQLKRHIPRSDLSKLLY